MNETYEQLFSDMVMYHINAVHFKSDWQIAFDAADIKDTKIQSTEGPVTAKLMNRAVQLKLRQFLCLHSQVYIVFDRPFAYGIVDEISSAPIFLGIMENPSI